MPQISFHVYASLCETPLSLHVHPAVPYEEDDRDPKIWFLDHSYLENMCHMFKKVNGEFKQPLASSVHTQSYAFRAVLYRTSWARANVSWDKSCAARPARIICHARPCGDVGHSAHPFVLLGVILSDIVM